MMNFDGMLEQAAIGELVNVEPGWGQGRATFGGLLGALIVAHLQANLPRQNTEANSLNAALRALTISFVAPVETGQVSITSQVLRTGKSVTQMLCMLKQNDQVCVSALASFGLARSSSIGVPALVAPMIAGPETGKLLPRMSGVAPEFTQLIDFGFIDGDLPFTAATTSHIDGWMRWNEKAGARPAQARYADLVALIDAWPPAVLQMLRQPTPSSSLTWTLEFPAIDQPQLANEANPWWQYRAVTESAHNGYAHIAAHCWDSAGQLVAISRQTAAVFG